MFSLSVLVESIRKRIRKGKFEKGRLFTPPEYRGGIDTKGVEALIKYAREGGQDIILSFGDFVVQPIILIFNSWTSLSISTTFCSRLLC